MDIIDIHPEEDQENLASFMTFPGGEPYVKVKQILGNNIMVKANIRSWDDWGRLICLLDALYMQGKYVYLFIPYFPGARQDRSCDLGTPIGTVPFSCQIYADQISRYVKQLIVFDIHSPKAEKIIRDQLQHVVVFESWELNPADLPADIEWIIAPDEGARVRAQRMREKHYPEAKIMLCTKKRDPKTGRLEKYNIPHFAAGISGRMLVVDDICDGGGTFNLLATNLESVIDKDKTELMLFVSHGIFSQGLEAINPLYKRIITTNSWCCLIPTLHNRLDIIDIDPLMSAFNPINKELTVS